MRKINTEKAPAAIGPYSQGFLTNSGLLFCSGQIALDLISGTLAGDTIEAQSEQVMHNIAALLEAAELSFENVVKTTCFLADMDDFSAFNAVYEKYFTGKPARSCVAVRSLPKGTLCEVEIIAECG